MTNNPLINDSFREIVESHIFGNLLIQDTYSPLILGIFGPPGEGKTYQLEKVCKSLEVTQTIISPGELESENAGYPAQLLRKLYLEAGTVKSTPVQQGNPKVLVINDIDTVLGNWGELVQYTVNRQTLYGQLMAFCDYPNQVSGHETKRVPIIITGNNPSILYPPLLRAGRMRLYPWEPTLKDKIHIVARIFEGISEGQINNLISKYPDQPISFWSDVDARFREIQLHIWLKNRSRNDLINNLRNRKEFAVGKKDATIDELEKIAYELNKANISKKTYLN